MWLDVVDVVYQTPWTLHNSIGNRNLKDGAFLVKAIGALWLELMSKGLDPDKPIWH